MGFKDYINESLIVEAKVKVGGKEFSSKKEAAIAMAEAGKKAEFIMKAIGTTEAMAKHFVSKYGNYPTKIDTKDPRNEKLKIKDAMAKATTNKERGVLKAKDTKAFNQEAFQYNQISLSNYLKRVTGNKDIYFDDVDLVVGDKTVLIGARDKMKDYDVQDLIDAIRKHERKAESKKADKIPDEVDFYTKYVKQMTDNLNKDPGNAKWKRELKSGKEKLEYFKAQTKPIKTAPSKDLKGVKKEMEVLGGVIDSLETKIKKLKSKGSMTEAGELSKKLKAAEDKMRILIKKEQDIIG